MVTISLCMIVRNEEAVLSRCLDSVKEIADEIIIVDTGSTDNTKAIAQGCTALVFDFPWVNDFAAARNYSFSKASMDYCMWMDADDILPASQQKKLLTWKQHTDCRNAPDTVMVKYITAFSASGEPAFSFYRERLLRRQYGFVWKGRVHETISPAGKIEYLDLSLEHHSQKTSYSDRNLNIYETMKAAGETLDARDQFYYARELYYHGQYSNAVENFLRFLALPHAFAENQAEACRIAAYCCYFLNEEERALNFLLKALTYRVPGGEICCDLGKHFMDRQDYKQAVFWYLSALHAPKEEQNGGFISEECYGYLPCLQLSVCYDRMGDIKNALKYHHTAGYYQPDGELYLRNQSYFLSKEKESDFEPDFDPVPTLH